MLTVILFFVLLSVLVLVHELGHFIVARLSGVKAEEFGFGFPPRLIGFIRERGKWKRVSGKDQQSYPQTIWSINWLPLGGFVRMKGEDGGAHDKDSFGAASWGKRAAILAAGVAMNWILAALIFSVGFAIGVPAELEGIPASAHVLNPHTEIVDVLAGSGAQLAGIKAGDTLLAVDGTVVKNTNEAQALIKGGVGTDGKIVVIRIERNKKAQDISVAPQFVSQVNRFALGVSMINTGTVRFPWYQAFPEGCVVAWNYTRAIVVGFTSVLHSLFVERKVAEGVSGPVGIAVMTGQAARQGVWSIFQFGALLSLNLAVINFLPIPALDGGRFLFLLLEPIRRRKMSPIVEGLLNRAGFFLLLALILLVTARDLWQYSGVIWHGLKHVVGL